MMTEKAKQTQKQTKEAKAEKAEPRRQATSTQFRRVLPGQLFLHANRRWKKVNETLAADARYEDDHVTERFDGGQHVELLDDDEQPEMVEQTTDHRDDDYDPEVEQAAHTQEVPAEDDGDEDVPSKTELHSAKKDQLVAWATDAGIETEGRTAEELRADLIAHHHPEG